MHREVSDETLTACDPMFSSLGAHSFLIYPCSLLPEAHHGIIDLAIWLSLVTQGRSGLRQLSVFLLNRHPHFDDVLLVNL